MKRKSTTIHLSLEEVVTRLSRHDAVDGLIVVGSASRAGVNPASDYDLVLVLSKMPIPLHVGVTNIDGRFADIIFHTTEQVEEILAASQPISFTSWTGRLLGWLQEGQIEFDRNGQLQAAQKKVQSGKWLLPVERNAGLSAWNRINYNLQVVRRHLSSDDPLYLLTADVKMMLYGPADLFFGYFESRGLRWRGEKAAIGYLQKFDPDYLSIFNQFLSEQNRAAKFQHYEELAERAVAHVAPLWEDGDVVMIHDNSNETSFHEEAALGFWQELIDD